MGLDIWLDLTYDGYNWCRREKNSSEVQTTKLTVSIVEYKKIYCVYYFEVHIILDEIRKMPHKGLATADGTCAICVKGFKKGALVYFDSTKNKGKHLVHTLCWEELLKSRGKTKPPGRAPVLSQERLDPPF